MTITDLLQEEVNKLKTELAERNKAISEYIEIAKVEYDKLLNENKELKEQVSKLRWDLVSLDGKYKELQDQNLASKE